MRFTPYSEPSAKEIDSLRQPPHCDCGEPVLNYGDTCEYCRLEQLEEQTQQEQNDDN